jgi:hypothetical protein
MMIEQMRTARRSKALFQALSNDFLLREQFVTDPATILCEYVHGKALERAIADGANQLLYAVFSTPAMLNWLRERASASNLDTSTDRAFAADLANAMGRHGDDIVASALLRMGASEGAAVSPALELLRSVGAMLGPGGRVSGGTEATPGTGTEATPGTGTQSTPGTGTQSTPGTGTQSTPGTGTQSTPGTGTQSTPGTGTQSTPGTGTQSTPGTGTRSTPGTGTRSTPGTGTEASVGGFGGLGVFEVTIRALVAYSRQLRIRGALAVTGFD